MAQYDNYNYAADAAKPVYKASYEDELKKVYDSITQRPSFSYDAGADPIYKKYRDDYVRQGRLAMKDSVGQASALTGGYGSSYAQNVGQQRYDEHLSRLGDIVPELYQLALSRYQAQGDALSERYNMLSRQRDEEYGRYRDELQRYEAAQEQEYERARQEKAEEERKAKESQQQRLDEAATLAKYGDFSGYAAIYGDKTAESMKKYWIASNPDAAYNMGLVDAAGYFAMTGKYSPGQSAVTQTGTKRATSYYPNTAPDGRDASVVQRELRNMGYNIAVDGAWGPRSQSAWDKVYGSGSMKLSSNPGALARV